MEQIRTAVGGGGRPQGGTLPQVTTAEQQQRGAQRGDERGGGGRWIASGGGRSAGGALPRLEGEGEGWERKEAGYGREGGWGGEEGGGWGAEEETGVPPATRRGEKFPADSSDWWNDWKFGLTYNNEEWGDALFWRAVLAEGCATTAFTYFLLSVGGCVGGHLMDGMLFSRC